MFPITFIKYCMFFILMSLFNSRAKKDCYKCYKVHTFKKLRKKKKIEATFCFYLGKDSCKTYCLNTYYCIKAGRYPPHPILYISRRTNLISV